MNTSIAIQTKLTKRENEILHLVANEFTASEIADQLFVSIHTVIAHRKNLQYKLKAKNSAGIVRRGFELGYLGVSQFSSVA